MLKFGEKVYIETLREELGDWLVLSHVGEDVTIVNAQGEIRNFNGSFVHPVSNLEENA